MNGTAIEHVIDTGLESPEAVVVDWIARNLYWADSLTERIEMSHVDGTARLVVVWKDIQPHSVAVDPHHGYVMSNISPFNAPRPPVVDFDA